MLVSTLGSQCVNVRNSSNNEDMPHVYCMLRLYRREVTATPQLSFCYQNLTVALAVYVHICTFYL